MEPAVMGRASVTLILLLGALAFVTWRQSRAFEVLSDLESVRLRVSEARAEQVELDRTIQFLESRKRVVTEARTRLGMHTPDATELVILAAVPSS